MRTTDPGTVRQFDGFCTSFVRAHKNNLAKVGYCLCFFSGDWNDVLGCLRDAASLAEYCYEVYRSRDIVSKLEWKMKNRSNDMVQKQT